MHQTQAQLEAFEVGEVLEGFEAADDFGIFERLQAVQGEILDVEGGDDTSHDDGAADVGVVEIAGLGQPAHEAAREGVASARGVEDVFQGISRSVKNAFFGKEESTIFAALDNQNLRAHRPN